MRELVLGIGGNQGNRIENLSKARKMIEHKLGKIILVSSLIESEPWGFVSDNWFLNQVLMVDCEHRPQQVLANIHIIEEAFGRIRTGEYTDRTIDIDILFYGNLNEQDAKLKIPHPHLHKRRFVIEPLAEILPDFIHPHFQKSCKELLLECSDTTSSRWLSHERD